MVATPPVRGESTIGLRDIRASDRAFLRAVYASTRLLELAPLGWSGPQVEAFEADELAHRVFGENFIKDYAETKRGEWEKDHLPNLSGTPMAWRPQGSRMAGRMQERRIAAGPTRRP